MRKRPSVTVDGKIVKALSDKQLDRHYRPYALALGHLVYSWNLLHDKLAELFWTISGINEGVIAFSIWHSTPSDLAQRKMLRAAAKANPNLGEDERAEILWVLKAIDDSLAHKRNDALHAPFEFLTRFTSDPILQPRTFPTGNPRALSLAGKDMLSEFAWYRKTAEVLSRHVALMDRYFAHPGQRTWPERPKLPHLARETTPKARSRQTRPKSPPPRPESSRG